MNDEEVILNLIKMSCEEENVTKVFEDKVLKMAQLLNINLDRYQKVKTKLIESGKIAKNGEHLFLT